MNKLKSIYMLILPMMLMSIVAMAIYQLFHKFDIGWIAVIMTTAPLLMFLMETILFKSKPRTNKFLPMHTTVVAMGLLLALILFTVPSLQKNIETNHLPLAIAELGFILHIAYIFWYSSLQRPIQNHLIVGESLPTFIVFKDNAKVMSESFLGFPTIIIFYRGNWCPFCMAQIKELAQQYRQLVLSGTLIPI